MTKFEIIPAIDILEGKCVRLERGNYSKKTIYADHPLEVAKDFEAKGARRLHVVDLDGAREGRPVNLSTIRNLVENVKIPIQVGGGIRSLLTIKEILGMGVQRVILGTSAVSDPDLVSAVCGQYGDSIIVSIDARGETAAIEGWTKQSKKKAGDLAKEMVSLGVRRIIYTDIKQDGMLSGPNIEGIKNFASKLEVPIIASGGISSPSDIEALRKIPQLEGCLIGKALYTGAIKLEEVLK